MLDWQSIRLKLERLQEDLERLESHRQLTREEFLGNDIIKYATCYLFLRAIQGCLDIGAELIALLGLRKPQNNAEIFLILGEESILPQDFIKRLVNMVGFRNILVHEYWLVDFDKVYDNLQNNLRDFPLFAQGIIAFLEKQGGEEEP
ncbi:MAG: type VII toxin-antitoxin system HepT family RNase toxin [Anaerolineae bacterium]